MRAARLEFHRTKYSFNRQGILFLSKRFSIRAAARNNFDNRASSKLFEDAAREEAEEKLESQKKRSSLLDRENENWTGEESMQDAVLRMLVDKYKPLRSGPIRTAEEKLKQAPPSLWSPTSTPADISTGDVSATAEHIPRSYPLANEPLLPSIEGHQPWHTMFTVPSHAVSNIRYGHIPPPPARTASPSSAVDERAKRKERDAKRRSEQASRLSRARESTLDYRLGIKGVHVGRRRPNPVSLKGWTSLVEDRIERARQAGYFKSVKGRGQPLQQVAEDSNPFIAREEFLMNRIVQRQGAAPPWVEIQGELESAVASFRDIVRQSWTRRAIRMLTLSQPPALLLSLTLEDIVSLRDAEWEKREQTYHDTAVEELNSLVRKYNGLAPYAVRKVYYSRHVELQRAFRESAEDIIRGLASRANNPGVLVGGLQSGGDDNDSSAGGMSADGALPTMRFREMLWDWWKQLRGG